MNKKHLNLPQNVIIIIDDDNDDDTFQICINNVTNIIMGRSVPAIEL